MGQDKSVQSRILDEKEVVILLRLSDGEVFEKLKASELTELDFINRNQSRGPVKYLGLVHGTKNGVVQLDSFDEKFGIRVEALKTADGYVVKGDKLAKDSKLRFKHEGLDFLAYVDSIK